MKYYHSVKNYNLWSSIMDILSILKSLNFEGFTFVPFKINSLAHAMLKMVKYDCGRMLWYPNMMDPL